MTRNIGVALGGGGIKGLAHIGLLKYLDKNNITIHKVSGTSMGAIIAALYAQGLSGNDIKKRVLDHTFKKDDTLKNIYQRRSQLLKWTKVFKLNISDNSLFSAEGLFDHLFNEIKDIHFSDLVIPLSISTTDFYSGKEVIITEGKVLPAVMASMAVPGVFSPVEIDKRMLIDGGLVNNVPTSHIQCCDIKIASDVIALPIKSSPKTLDIINGGVNIMLQHITSINLKKYPASLIIRPDTHDIDFFDFNKIEHAVKKGDDAITDVIREEIDQLTQE